MFVFTAARIPKNQKKNEYHNSLGMKMFSKKFKNTKTQNNRKFSKLQKKNGKME